MKKYDNKNKSNDGTNTEDTVNFDKLSRKFNFLVEKREKQSHGDEGQEDRILFSGYAEELAALKEEYSDNIEVFLKKTEEEQFGNGFGNKR